MCWISTIRRKNGWFQVKYPASLLKMTLKLPFKNLTFQDWGTHPVVKSSCTTPEFSSQHPHWVVHNCLSLQLQGIQCPLLNSVDTLTQVAHIHTCSLMHTPPQTHTHKEIMKANFKNNMSPGVMIPILKYLICCSYHFLWEAERMAVELRNIPQNQPN